MQVPSRMDAAIWVRNDTSRQSFIANVGGSPENRWNFAALAERKCVSTRQLYAKFRSGSDPLGGVDFETMLTSDFDHALVVLRRFRVSHAHVSQDSPLGDVLAQHGGRLTQLAEFSSDDGATMSRVFFSCWLMGSQTRIAMFEKGLEGTYHIGARVSMSKLEFPRGIARIFELDSGLIESSSLASAELFAPRPSNTSLKVLKASEEIGVEFPTVEEQLVRLRSLEESGYVSALRESGSLA